MNTTALQFGKTLTYSFKADENHDSAKANQYFMDALGERQSNGLHTLAGQDVFVATLRDDDEPVEAQIYTGTGATPKTLLNFLIAKSQQFIENGIKLGPTEANTEAHNDAPPVDENEGRFNIIESYEMSAFTAEGDSLDFLPQQLVVTSNDLGLGLLMSHKNKEPQDSDDRETILGLEADREEYLLVYNLQGELLGTTPQVNLLKTD